jgi:hypothetical protein
MLRSMTIWRTIATQRDAARLTCSQVHPAAPDLHTLFTFMPFGELDELNRFDMRASFLVHSLLFSHDIRLAPEVE